MNTGKSTIISLAPHNLGEAGPKSLTRQCVICGNDILVTVFADGKYTGGNYFHSVSECGHNGDCVDIYRCHPEHSRGISQKRSEPALDREYWECYKCYFDKERK